MTKYTDADALVEFLDKQFELIMGSEGYYSQYAQGYEMATIDVDKFPAADVVEVVRCKDCARCKVEIDHDPECPEGEELEEFFCKLIEAYMNPEGFCSNAVRKRGTKMDKEEQ